MAKGQVELIVILGLIIVVAAVAYYVFSGSVLTPSAVPAEVAEEYKLVSASVESLMREAALNSMREIGVQGGYNDYSYPLGSVQYMGREIPFWQSNGRVEQPDVSQNLVSRISDYVNLYKDTLAGSDPGVSFGDASITNAQFLPNKIVLTMSMPTTLKDVQVNVPYTAEVQTRFAEIEDFAGKFSQLQNAQRPLEYFTVASMLQSPAEGGFQTVPLFVPALTQCGEYVFKGYSDVQPEAELLVKNMLGNVYMPGKVETHADMYAGQRAYGLDDAGQLQGCIGNPDCPFVDTGVPYTPPQVTGPRYVLPLMGGKDFSGIDVSFDVADDFGFDYSSFQMSPDPISSRAELIDLTSVCLSDPVNVNYYLYYPVIVRARDPDTGNLFEFAVTVYVLDNRPGAWSSTPAGLAGREQADVCGNASCRADILAVDSAGAPLPDVYVSYMGCSAGRTDQAGRIRTLVPCGMGEVQVQKKGYGTYSLMATSSDLSNATVTLLKSPSFEARIHQVAIQETAGDYVIYPDAVRALDDGMVADVGFYPVTGGRERYVMALTGAGEKVDFIPAGTYGVAASLRSGEGSNVGSMMAYFTLQESDDRGVVHIYVPGLPEYSASAGDAPATAEMMARLSNLLLKCGIDPVSRENVKEIPTCTVAKDDPQL
jgi:hypothetical protein